MRVGSFAEIDPEFIERAHPMVWCDMATVSPDRRPRTRIGHPVWDGGAARIAIWKRIAALPEPLGYDTEAMFGSYDFPDLIILRLKAWRIRLAVAGDVARVRRPLDRHPRRAVRPELHQPRRDRDRARLAPTPRHECTRGDGSEAARIPTATVRISAPHGMDGGLA